MRVPVKAGLHEVGVSFVGRSWEPEGILQPPQTGFGRTTNEYYHGNPAVEIVSIGGPYGAPGSWRLDRPPEAVRLPSEGRGVGGAVCPKRFCQPSRRAPIGGQ